MRQRVVRHRVHARLRGDVELAPQAREVERLEPLAVDQVAPIDRHEGQRAAGDAVQQLAARVVSQLAPELGDGVVVERLGQRREDQPEDLARAVVLLVDLARAGPADGVGGVLQLGRSAKPDCLRPPPLHALGGPQALGEGAGDRQLLAEVTTDAGPVVALVAGLAELSLDGGQATLHHLDLHHLGVVPLPDVSGVAHARSPLSVVTGKGTENKPLLSPRARSQAGDHSSWRGSGDATRSQSSPAFALPGASSTRRDQRGYHRVITLVLRL